jgi:hypothetical protein
MHVFPVRIIFLDFRKAYDLVDHNKLLENCEKIGVRPALNSAMNYRRRLESKEEFPKEVKLDPSQ